jgi:hypothetical protein
MRRLDKSVAIVRRWSVPAFGDSDPPWLTSPKAHSSKNRREPLPIVVAAAVQKTSSRTYWSVISPSNSTFSLNPATSSVTFAGNVSVPAMVPSARGRGHCVLDLALRIDANHF